MSRIGLALSGGGFRATLYHLGVIRYLRDARMLPNISHITSVSGGSIMAAHLVLNWDRYNGTEEEFDEVAEELLNFIRMDIRNRIVRRFPLAALANNFRFLVGKKRSRYWSRCGLLELHYQKYLFGDKCLYELPVSPQLHMLTTNVNEGCLCSFTRSGLLVQRHMPDRTRKFEQIEGSLASVAMAVTASSAFPGFFPPLLLKAEDVGVDESRFQSLLFTDGGIYDNLGVRMFREIQDSWIGHFAPLTVDDIHKPEKFIDKMQQASNSEEKSPFSQLVKLIRRYSKQRDGALITADQLPEVLWNVIKYEKLYEKPLFQELKLQNNQAEDLFHLAKHGRKLDKGDHFFLNKSLVNAASYEKTQKNLLKSIEPAFDGVIVSDAGKQFTISRKTRSGGLLGTALRSSDIVMNRVWQLEKNHFGQEKDFIFVPMSETVYLEDDPYALHPELQKQATNTRTDLDRFTELEMSSLIRHGYGVMRKVSRANKGFFQGEIPEGPLWDPTLLKTRHQGSSDSPDEITKQARELQGASHRQILGRLLNLRDWPTYIFIPLLILVFAVFPYFAYQRYKVNRRTEMIVDAITESNPDFQLVMGLVRRHPLAGEWKAFPINEVDELKPISANDFDIITDTRVVDMRAWKGKSAQADGSKIFGFRRIMVRRKELLEDEKTSTPNPGIFKFEEFLPTKDISVRCDTPGLNPVFQITPHQNTLGQDGFLGQAEFDLSHVPVGDDFFIGFESMYSSDIQSRIDENRIVIPIIDQTRMISLWVILPNGFPYQSFEMVKFQTDTMKYVVKVDPTYRFEMKDASLFGWMLVAPDENYTYECLWTWPEE